MAEQDERAAFEAWLRRNPNARLWNATDAMFAAFLGGLAATPAPAEPVAWFKHGPYEEGEPLSVVFENPHDDECYSALVFADAKAATPAPAEPVGTVTFTESMGATFVFKHALTIKPGDTFELLRAKQGKEASNG